MISVIAGLITLIAFTCIAIHFIRKAYEWFVISLFKGIVKRRGGRNIFYIYKRKAS